MGVTDGAYGHIGSMRTTPGHREQVVALLLSGVDGLRRAGCQLYVVGTADTDDVTIWVSEVWASAEQHDAALQLPAAKAAIAQAMPMLTGEFSSRELTVIGGLGVSG